MDWNDEARKIVKQSPEEMTDFIVERAESFAKERGYPEVTRESIAEQMEELGMNLDEMLD